MSLSNMSEPENKILNKCISLEDNQESLKEMLNNEFTILQSYNGEEGLKIATSKFPDLIVSDVMMPIMDGIEFAKKTVSLSYKLS